MKHKTTSKRLLHLSMGAIYSLSVLLAPAAMVRAEGTHQFNEQQGLRNTTDVFVDIMNAGETINVSSCVQTEISIWGINNTPADKADDTQLVTSQAIPANISCTAALPNPITDAYTYTPAEIGTYRISLTDDLPRYDFSVTANNTTDPDPTQSAGRVWSYSWDLSTASVEAANATDANLYVLVPAPVAGESTVWQLDLNKFSGKDYSIKANSRGLDAPNSGLSAPTASSAVTPEYAIYLGYPAKAGTASTTEPVITGEVFVDDANEDNAFSPSTTPGVQDTGSFKFSNDLDNVTYAVTVDTTKDGIYGTGDRLILGDAVKGENSVVWDGKDPSGTVVSDGTYTAQIQLRTGEFHFIASDVETSGGTTDNGTTWSNGLTIYRATDATTVEPVTVFWDDITKLGSVPDATSNTPLGVESGTTADNNNDGRADGFHTWGRFDSEGLGNNNNLDTYAYSKVATKTVSVVVAAEDSPASDNDGIDAAVEDAAPNDGDGNNDDTKDSIQDDVTSLPNPVANNVYQTLATANCNQQNSVSIMPEADAPDDDSNFDYPLGLMGSTITCQNPGDTAAVTIYFAEEHETATWTPRALAGEVYIDIADAMFSTTQVGESTVTKMVFEIKDGGPLDADGEENGTIQSIVGPGVASNEPTPTPTPSPSPTPTPSPTPSPTPTPTPKPDDGQHGHHDSDEDDDWYDCFRGWYRYARRIERHYRAHEWSHRRFSYSSWWRY